MEKDTKLVLGKILGEIYRLQRANDQMACPVGPEQIYALLNGFEGAVDQELEMLGFVSKEQVRTVMDVLEPIWRDPEKLESFKGFYDIETELSSRGVDRGKALRILTYLNANYQFREVIKKMDSSDSPAECRTFELSEWDT